MTAGPERPPMKIPAEVGQRIANVSLVAALAVVLLHIGIAGTSEAGEFFARRFLRDFARFAVPFFFLVSGFLLAGHVGEAGWWRRETVKRVRTLLLPYVLWSALFGLYLLIGVAVPELRRSRAFDFAAWWQGKELLLFGLDVRQTPLMLPLWYLRTLFLLVCLSGVLVQGVRRFGGWLLATLGVIYLTYSVLVDWRPELTVNDLGASLRATFAPEAFFYFTLGLWLRLRGVVPSARIGSVPLLAVAAVLLTVRQFVGPWLPHPVIIPLTICGVWCAVPAKSWPKAVTSLSFPIYLLHWFVIHLLVRTHPEAGTTPLSFPLVFLGTVAVTTLAALLLRRFAPAISTRLFGGR